MRGQRVLNLFPAAVPERVFLRGLPSVGSSVQADS